MTKRVRGGFTLVELLVVIAIIGVLVGLLLPAVQAAREAARRMSCSNNIKQLGLALHNYHDTFNAVAPLRNRDDTYAGDDWNTQSTSWMARILPFIEQQPLHDQIDYSHHNWWSSAERPKSNNWGIVNRTVVAAYRCPSDGGKGSVTWTDPSGNRVQGHLTSSDYADTNYFGCTGPDSELRWNGAGLGFFDAIRRTNATNAGSCRSFADVVDGLSTTVMVSEGIIGHPRVNSNPEPGASGNYQAQANNYPINDNHCPNGPPNTSSTNARGNSWFRGYSGNDFAFNTLMAPNSKLWDCHANSNWSMYAARSQHPGGVQAGIGDGSVRFVTDSIDVVQWRALGGTHDGVVANFP